MAFAPLIYDLTCIIAQNSPTSLSCSIHKYWRLCVSSVVKLVWIPLAEAKPLSLRCRCNKTITSQCSAQKTLEIKIVPLNIQIFNILKFSVLFAGFGLQFSMFLARSCAKANIWTWCEALSLLHFFMSKWLFEEISAFNDSVVVNHSFSLIWNDL